LKFNSEKMPAPKKKVPNGTRGNGGKIGLLGGGGDHVKVPAGEKGGRKTIATHKKKHGSWFIDEGFAPGEGHRRDAEALLQGKKRRLPKRGGTRHSHGFGKGASTSQRESLGGGRGRKASRRRVPIEGKKNSLEVKGSSQKMKYPSRGGKVPRPRGEDPSQRGGMCASWRKSRSGPTRNF